MNTSNWKFKFGDPVKKIKNAEWEGFVVGFYTSSLTVHGYAIESNEHIGSVQIYPEEALELNKICKKK